MFRQVKGRGSVCSVVVGELSQERVKRVQARKSWKQRQRLRNSRKHRKDTATTELRTLGRLRPQVCWSRRRGSMRQRWGRLASTVLLPKQWPHRALLLAFVWPSSRLLQTHRTCIRVSSASTGAWTDHPTQSGIPSTLIQAGWKLTNHGRVSRRVSIQRHHGGLVGWLDQQGSERILVWVLPVETLLPRTNNLVMLRTRRRC